MQCVVEAVEAEAAEDVVLKMQPARQKSCGVCLVRRLHGDRMAVEPETECRLTEDKPVRAASEGVQEV